MPQSTATDLKSLHLLHQRAKALRDRLESGPKTLASRQKSVETKKKSLEDARTALKTSRADIHKREMVVQTARSRVDELRVKLNNVRKNDEYKAITNQIAMDNKSIAKQEDEILDLMAAVEKQAQTVAEQEAEFQKVEAEYQKLKDDFEGKAEQFREQLKELDDSIIESESIIPEEDRERYRRSVKGQGANAFSAVDPNHPSCSGCFVSITAQGINEMMINESLVFCKTCGRILYLAED